jgi:hypothetical protein
MNPFNDSKPKASQQAHGYQSQPWTSRVDPEEKKDSGMFGWMWKEEEQPKISSVNDFLAQPMPY